MIINPYNLFWDGTDRVDNYSYPYLPQKVLFGFGRKNVDRDYPYYFCNADIIELMKYTRLTVKNN